MIKRKLEHYFIVNVVFVDMFNSYYTGLMLV